ncbi:MAG: FAD-binding protein, partial [Alphaproteobacteria bacterium]
MSVEPMRDGQALSKIWDVLVAGGGNAALSAAITARRAGASVLLVEHAPRSMRGGNSRHTRNLRALHPAPTEVLTESYLEEEYWDDLLRVTGGKTDEHLARMCIRASQHAPDFLKSCGVVFQPSLSGTLSLSRTNAFFLGGGKALVNALYRTAEQLGIGILYDTEVQHIDVKDGFATEAIISHHGFPERVRFKALIAAAGGFQANRDWLRKDWGDAADNFQIRGTPYAQGRVLRDLLDQGVHEVGDPTQFHAVANDARAP